jgi:hypothetical protein
MTALLVLLTFVGACFWAVHKHAHPTECLPKPRLSFLYENANQSRPTPWRVSRHSCPGTGGHRRGP